MQTKNEFLLLIGREARKKRKLFWDNYHYSIRISKRKNKVEGGLWFKTKGCTYDHQGGCLMCDYSVGSPTSPEDMANYVKEGLENIKECCEQLLVSPSGSMLDKAEVPTEALGSILDLLKKSEHKVFSFETRVDSINEESVKYCSDKLGDRFYRVFLGVESANPWILKYSINKMLDLNDYIQAVKTLHKYNVKVAANIIISAPFLTIKENLNIAVQSVRWVISQGADECFIFPIHIKKDTPLEFLYSEGMFEPPSLWQLVEVMKRLGRETCERYIRLSWFTSYGAYNIIASPTTCDKCKDQVISLLEEFDNTSNFDLIEQIDSIHCDCKKRWRDEVEGSNSDSLEDRVIEGYKALGKKFKGEDWWNECAETIVQDLKADAEAELYHNQISFVNL